jgi:2-hydroxy-6-oxonona-2,4-dienedioate hydrolase
VAIEYPAVERLDDAVRGLATVLDAERIGTADVVGGSFGGLLAQALIRAIPHRVRRVVLSATGPADPARRNDRWARLFARVPMALTRGLLRVIVRASLARVGDEAPFWREFYNRAVRDVTRDDIHARYALSADIDRLGPPTPEELARWHGAVLIVEGDHDPVASARTRAALRAIFPTARVRTIAGGGHAVSMERPLEWAGAVRDFVVGAEAA